MTLNFAWTDIVPGASFSSTPELDLTDAEVIPDETLALFPDEDSPYGVNSRQLGGMVRRASGGKQCVRRVDAEDGTFEFYAVQIEHNPHLVSKKKKRGRR